MGICPFGAKMFMIPYRYLNWRLQSQYGFVELCVSDTGLGIPATLENAYRQRYQDRNQIKLAEDVVIKHDSLLKFAFDELGTRKDEEESWITNRHALGHTLFIIAKYGGVLSVRSGDAALTYSSEGGNFKRCDNQLGYEPTSNYSINPRLRGTHLQLLIPLKPQRSSDNQTPKKLYQHLPVSFHIDSKHPVGPLIPLHEKLSTFGICITGSQISIFKESIRTLAREILQGRYSRNEPLVFDFSETDWTPAQFETFLYLMQNVLVNRLVLFTQVPHEFAALVNDQEDEEQPSYLPKFIEDEIQQRELDREFTEGKFLETYSGLGSLVLGLGPDRGEYLFGVRGKSLRRALLELINNEKQSIDGLSKSHGLDVYTLEVVLNHASLLFEVNDENLWDSVFIRRAPNQDDIEVQRLRAITKNFDIIAKSCGAWRGIDSSQDETHVSNNGDRFYLPTENVIYTEFLEISRIVARERYAIEIAERLIYRICQGLDAMNLSINDVDILACSTTPTVMIAEAIRRAWPIGPVTTDKRPVVIDYGPSLFSGIAPAHIPIIENKKPRAIVVHDLFDQGTLSEKLASLLEIQGSNVLFVLTFIKFLLPDELHDSDAVTFPPEHGWKNIHQLVGKPVHSMMGLRRPQRVSIEEATDWGTNELGKDYIVDPRSLRPIPLKSLRLESNYSEERSLTNRDLCLKELDRDEGICRLAAGHFVYGYRHFAVIVDVRGLLTGAIGRKIIKWLAALCCGDPDRNKHWSDKPQDSCPGPVTAILIPLHSQIYYILHGLQIEIAQRGRRVPHFFLDSTSLGGGVETYDIPYQLKDQIWRAAIDIKSIVDDKSLNGIDRDERVKKRQLRLLFIDDAIFSGSTLQTVLNSLGKHVANISKNVFGDEDKYDRPIDWIRAFIVLNELPAAKSALWHKLNNCSASSNFRFDEYAPFIGTATFSAADCPLCKEIDQLDLLLQYMKEVSAKHAIDWINDRKKAIAPIATEAPSFQITQSVTLPEQIDVLVSPGAPNRYKPYHVDSAIWRFYELMHLSYPLRDILKCLETTRDAGRRHSSYRNEYARFRLAVYEWCIQKWHQVTVYNAEKLVLDELRKEVEGGEPIFIEITYRLNSIVTRELEYYDSSHPVIEFVMWAIDLLALKDADEKRIVDKITLDLDTALTLLFFSFSMHVLESTNLLAYLNKKQSSMPRKTSFLTLLYLRITQPKTDPKWALTTIAEICYRGRVGDTPEERLTTDHQLLPQLITKIELDPKNEELRRRVGGSLQAFITAIENLNPYFEDNVLPEIYKSACDVREWLNKKVKDAIEDQSPLLDLSSEILDYEKWKTFETNCHMSVNEFIKQIKIRIRELKEKKDIGYLTESNLIVIADDKISEWCIMTSIPRLISYVSNIAIEPMKTKNVFQPSRIEINKSCESQFINIDIYTYIDSDKDTLKVITESPKIAHDRERLEFFGVHVNEPVIDYAELFGGLHFSLIVPVGFQARRR